MNLGFEKVKIISADNHTVMLLKDRQGQQKTIDNNFSQGHATAPKWLKISLKSFHFSCLLNNDG